MFIEYDLIADWAGHQLYFLSNLCENQGGDNVSSDKNVRGLFLETVQVLLTGLGDMSRNKELYREDQTIPLNYGCCAAYYYHAFISSPNGSLHKRIASLYKSFGETSDMIFHLFLAMLSTQKPFNARDSIVDILNNQRVIARSLPEVDALSLTTARDHHERYFLHLWSCLSILLSRIDTDTFNYHLERMRRHISSLLQIKTNVISTKSNISMETIASSQETLLLEHSITSGLIAILSTVYTISERNNVKSIIDEDMKFGIQLTDDNIVPIEVIERAWLRKLNEIRSIPGLLDSIRMMCAFISCIIGGSGIGLYASAQDSSGGNRDLTRFATTLQSVKIFLRFVALNDWLKVIPLLDSSAWEQVTLAMKSYFSVLNIVTSNESFKSSTGNGDILLDEDIMLRNFIPLNINQNSLTSEHLLSLFQIPAENSFDSLSDLIRKRVDKNLESQTDRFMIRALQCRDFIKLLSDKCVVLHQSSMINITMDKDKLIWSDSLMRARAESQPKISIYFDKNMKPVPQSSFNDVLENSMLKLMQNNILMQSNAINVPARLSASSNKSKMSLPGFGLKIQNDPVTKSQNIDDADNSKTEIESNNITENLEVGKIMDQQDLDDINLFESLAETLKLEDANVEDDDNTETPGMLRLNARAVESMKQIATSQDNGEQKLSKEAKRNQKLQKAINKRKESDALVNTLFPGRRIGIDKGSFKSEIDLPLIVLDSPNIAMRHGLNSRFSCLGLRIVFDFFLHMGHKVIGFLPDYYFDMERVGELRRAANAGVKSTRAARLPDDIHILQQLAAQGYLVGTPSQDYDDSYCIGYARSHNAYLVTNDMYR
jgi:hypothetical protein